MIASVFYTIRIFGGSHDNRESALSGPWPIRTDTVYLNSCFSREVRSQGWSDNWQRWVIYSINCQSEWPTILVMNNLLNLQDCELLLIKKVFRFIWKARLSYFNKHNIFQHFWRPTFRVICRPVFPTKREQLRRISFHSPSLTAQGEDYGNLRQPLASEDSKDTDGQVPDTYHQFHNVTDMVSMLSSVTEPLLYEPSSSAPSSDNTGVKSGYR